MTTFKRVRIESEKELHEVIQKELDAIEEGLELLKYEFGTGKGEPDFLCVDSGGRLTIIEVKLQEDENILFQALRYYNLIDKDRYAIAQIFKDKTIDPNQNPRIVLIAEKFSDDLRRLGTLVVPDVELFEYSVLSTGDGKTGIHYHPVSLPKVAEAPTAPPTVNDRIDYITDEKIKGLFKKIIDEVSSIGSGIEYYPTHGYIGFKFRGRQFAWLGSQRKSFDFGSHIINEKGKLQDYESIRIVSGEDDYSDILEKVKKSYINLGEKLKK